MTPEEVKALLLSELETMLTPMLKTYHEQVQSFVVDSISTAVQPIEDLVTKPTKGTKAKADQDDQDNPLLARLSELEAKLTESNKAIADKEKQALELEFGSVLAKELDQHSPVQRGLAQELLGNRIKSKAVKDGKGWQVEGKDLTSVVQNFFESEEGKHFLPSTYKGAGSDKPTQVSQGAKGLTSDQAIREAFRL